MHGGTIATLWRTVFLLFSCGRLVHPLILALKEVSVLISTRDYLESPSACPTSSWSQCMKIPMCGIRQRVNLTSYVPLVMHICGAEANYKAAGEPVSLMLPECLAPVFIFPPPSHAPTLSPSLLPFFHLSILSFFLFVVVVGHTYLCSHTEDIQWRRLSVLFYHSPPYSPEIRSLTGPGYRW